MAQEWLLELLIGTGRLLMNPVFYILFFLAAYLGVNRVKRERKNFTVRVENAYFELRQLIPTGLLIGLILSLIIIATGIVIPLEMIIIAAIITVLFALTTKVQMLSPAYAVAGAILATMVLTWQKWSMPFIEQMPDVNISYAGPVLLLGLLIIAEGLMISANGPKGTSPKLISGKRGDTVGAHELRRVWLLPVFLLMPGDALRVNFEWWPVFSIGGESYSLILVPFAVGIYHLSKALLPQKAIKIQGKRVVLLGILTMILGAVGYFYPLVNIAAVAIAIAGRMIISLSQSIKERNMPFLFSKKNHGVMILGVLLNSPASKMQLKVGEIITKVNGQQVHNEKSFYEALQRNRAHCKLEVFDVNGEIRFVQRALFEGEHHKLGILFVEDEKRKSGSRGAKVQVPRHGQITIEN